MNKSTMLVVLQAVATASTVFILNGFSLAFQLVAVVGAVVVGATLINSGGHNH